MALVHDKGINEYLPVRKAYDKAREILNSDKPDEKELSEIVKQLDSHPEAVEWLRLEEGVKYDLLHAKLMLCVEPRPISVWSLETKSDDITFLNGFNGKDIGFAEGNWNECITQLKENNLEMLTARQLAELRMKHGRNSKYSQKDVWLKEAVVYQPDGSLIMVPGEYNVLIADSKNATRLRDAEYMLPHEGYLSTLDMTKCLFLPRKEIPNRVLVKDLGSNPVACFLFGNLAGDYGKFLQEGNHRKMYFSVLGAKYARKQNHNFIRALALSQIFEGVNFSFIWGNDKNYLYNPHGSSFGLRKVQGDVCPRCGSGTYNYCGCTFCRNVDCAYTKAN